MFRHRQTNGHVRPLGRQTRGDIRVTTQVRRLVAISAVFGANCLAQIQDRAPCRDAKDFKGVMATELGREGRHCAISGYIALAEDAFDGGRLAEALRSISAAIRLIEADPENANRLLGALRIQGAVYVERGMLSEALAVMERLKALPVESPEQGAAVRGLAGAYYQSAGDHRVAEREYLQAIQAWDSLGRSEDAVSERSNLGVLYLASGRLDEAVAVLERAYASLAVSVKNAAYYRLVVTNNLAVAYSQRGDTVLAVQHARAAVRLAETARVGRYQLTATVYSNSADVLRAAGHKKEANELGHRAGRAEALSNAVVDYSDLGGDRQRRP